MAPPEVHGYFILDVSALTKGLSSIKSWFESDQYEVKLFIPSYTIHELDYLKSGSSMLARNARESIRFIDKWVSDEHDRISELIIETPDQIGPSWKQCIKYKNYAPKVSEFDNTKFLAPRKVSRKENMKDGDITYEEDLINEGHSLSDVQEPQNDRPQERAEMPNRMKYLIRPCVKKAKLDKEYWVLITEESSTRIWCEAYSINCVNLTQAESMLFHAKNDIEVTKSKALRGPRGGRKPPEKRNDVVIERFNSVSYAPRGNGELWVP